MRKGYLEQIALKAKVIGLYIDEEIDENTLTGKTKIKFKDKDGYLYSFSRENIHTTTKRNGIPCTFFNNNPYTFNNINRYFEINNIELRLVTDNPKNAVCKLDFKCLKHNLIFNRSWNRVKNGHIGCNECSGCVAKHTIETARENLSSKRCELMTDKWYGTGHYYNFKCECGNVFYRRYCVVSSQGNDRCSDCTGCIHKHSHDYISKDLIDNGVMMLSEKYKDVNSKLNVVYKKCGCVADRSYQSIRDSHYNCPKCTKPSFKRESEIYNYLIRHGIKLIKTKEFSNLIGVGGKLLSYDFYIIGTNILIEVQGKQHRMPVCFGGISKQEAISKFKIQQEHDKRKREYAKNNGYELIEIWYDEDYKTILKGHESVSFLFEQKEVI